MDTKILLTTKVDLEVSDARDISLRVILPAGTHEMEEVNDPLCMENNPWWLKRGTTIGASKSFFQKHQRSDYGKEQVKIKRYNSRD